MENFLIHNEVKLPNDYIISIDSKFISKDLVDFLTEKGHNTEELYIYCEGVYARYIFAFHPSTKSYTRVEID